jgi:hypothetical protein
MKYLLLLFFISGQLMAQSQYDFMGFLFMEDYRPISYRIVLDEDDGVMNGYSITGSGTSFETKSELSGTYIKKEMKLKEFQIISTKSEEPLSNFCFIDFVVLKEAKGFSGDFIGKFPDGKICAEGKIVFAKKSKFDKKIAKAKKIQEVLTKRLENKPVLLKSGDEHQIGWENKKIRIELWDSAIEDNDRISVLLNGVIVLNNKEMKNKKEVLKLELLSGENILEFVAENEGEMVNNTTRIELIDRKTKHPLLAELQVGKRIKIKIVL